MLAENRERIGRQQNEGRENLFLTSFFFISFFALKMEAVNSLCPYPVYTRGIPIRPSPKKIGIAGGEGDIGFYRRSSLRLFRGQGVDLCRRRQSPALHNIYLFIPHALRFGIEKDRLRAITPIN